MKIISYLRWILFGIITPGIITVFAYVLFPIAYLLRKPIRKWMYEIKTGRWICIPLWIFLDDEAFVVNGHDSGDAWFRISKGLKIYTPWGRFKAAYLWGVVRNPAWNMYELIHPRVGDKIKVSAKGQLTQDGIDVNIYNFATLKYVDSLGNYMDNKGSFLSLYYSTIGKSKVWYKIRGRLYWRYSFAGYIKRWNRWIEIHAGTTDKRYTLRFKIKKTEVFEDYTHVHFATTDKRFYQDKIN